MKYFEIEIINKGVKSKKIIKANSKQEARNIAKTKYPGIISRSVETSTPMEEIFNKTLTQIKLLLVSKNIKTPNLIAITRQLAVMTNAGISIHDSIKEVIKCTEDKFLKKIFEEADDDLNSGQSLTSSLNKYKFELGEITLAMIKLGEDTGNMSESLEKLSDILEESYKNQQKFKKAIRYPITVVIAIVIAFTILMLYVVPKFKEIFDKLETELPLPTVILLNIESAMSNYGLFILGFFAILFFIIKRLYKTNKDFKYMADKTILKTYLIGDIVSYSSMAKFNLIFSELTRAGIPIAESLDTTTYSIGNLCIQKKLMSIKVNVQRGVSLTEAFRETELYEGMLIQMINAGEQGGSLDAMLSKVTDYYKSKFDDIIDNISASIEPILIGFIAVMVIFLALGIFMPMWDMASAVKMG